MPPDHIGHNSTGKGYDARDYFACSGDSTYLKAVQTKCSNDLRQHYKKALAEPVENPMTST